MGLKWVKKGNKWGKKGKREEGRRLVGSCHNQTMRGKERGE